MLPANRTGFFHDVGQSQQQQQPPRLQNEQVLAYIHHQNQQMMAPHQLGPQANEATIQMLQQQRLQLQQRQQELMIAQASARSVQAKHEKEHEHDGIDFDDLDPIPLTTATPVVSTSGSSDNHCIYKQIQERQEQLRQEEASLMEHREQVVINSSGYHPCNRLVIPTTFSGATIIGERPGFHEQRDKLKSKPQGGVASCHPPIAVDTPSLQPTMCLPPSRAVPPQCAAKPSSLPEQAVISSGYHPHGRTVIPTTFSGATSIGERPRFHEQRDKSKSKPRGGGVASSSLPAATTQPIMTPSIPAAPQCAGKPSFSPAPLLHQACRLYSDTLAVIDGALRLDPSSVSRRVFTPIDDAPPSPNAAPRKKRGDGYDYPINIALHLKAPFEIIKLLAEAGPEVLMERDGPNACGSLTLALSLGCGKEIVELLLEQNPHCAFATDRHENLALHTACRKNSSLEIVELLLGAFPQAMHERNFHGQTPLDVAQGNTCCTDERVLDYLQELSFKVLEDQAAHLLSDEEEEEDDDQDEVDSFAI